MTDSSLSCPACQKAELNRVRRLRDELSSQYGIMPEEQYVEAALALEGEQLDVPKLREKLKVSIDEDGLQLTYSVVCPRCGFSKRLTAR